MGDHDGSFNIHDLVDLEFENRPSVAAVVVEDVDRDAQMEPQLSNGNVTHNPSKRPPPVESLDGGNLHHPNPLSHSHPAPGYRPSSGSRELVDELPASTPPPQQPTLNLRTPESLGATSGAIPMSTRADMYSPSRRLSSLPPSPSDSLAKSMPAGINYTLTAYMSLSLSSSRIDTSAGPASPICPDPTSVSSMCCGRWPPPSPPISNCCVIISTAIPSRCSSD